MSPYTPHHLSLGRGSSVLQLVFEDHRTNAPFSIKVRGSWWLQRPKNRKLCFWRDNDRRSSTNRRSLAFSFENSRISSLKIETNYTETIISFLWVDFLYNIEFCSFWDQKRRSLEPRFRFVILWVVLLITWALKAGIVGVFCPNSRMEPFSMGCVWFPESLSLVNPSAPVTSSFSVFVLFSRTSSI